MISDDLVVVDTASLTAGDITSSSDIPEQTMPTSPTSVDDGWGELENGIHEDQETDKDGWDDIEPAEEPKPSAVLASIQAAQKRPVVQPKSQGIISLSILFRENWQGLSHYSSSTFACSFKTF